MATLICRFAKGHSGDRKGDSPRKIIERGTVISVRLISVANSPVYRRTEKIYSVGQAIPRLGFKEIRNIITAITNKSLYETKNKKFRMLMEKLWMHSLVCAYASRLIAKKLRLVDEEQFFLMGLIHDIGKPPLLKFLSESISRNESLTMKDIMASVQKIHTTFGKDILEH
ncbi:MAG: HDOD domain-containing protein [Desulfatiglandales bacterium]|jgi:HD-like signal output (HDOD) protein|nr:HDOD domain-containing protein [Desulfatiglandales bacterium]